MSKISKKSKKFFEKFFSLFYLKIKQTKQKSKKNQHKFLLHNFTTTHFQHKWQKRIVYQIQQRTKWMNKIYSFKNFINYLLFQICSECRENEFGEYFWKKLFDDSKWFSHRDYQNII